MRLPEVPVEVVAWRLTARGPQPRATPAPAAAGSASAPRTQRRIALLPGAPDVPVYDRATLGAAQRIAGPAIIEERETTLVILPGWVARRDATGAIIATRGEH